MNMNDFTHKVMPIKNKLYRFALRMVGSVEEAEDVVQEVLVKIWQKGTELTKVNNIEALGMTMTRNLSIDKMRSKHYKVKSLDNQLIEKAGNDNPQKTTELNDAVSRVHDLIQDLPEKQRAIIQLRDIEGKTYKEIGEILSIPANQVKVNLFRARKNIRQRLLKIDSYGL